MSEEIINALVQLVKEGGATAVLVALILQIKYLLGWSVGAFTVYQIARAVKYCADRSCGGCVHDYKQREAE